MDSSEKWHAVKEVAVRFGVSGDTIRRRMRAGKIRALRVRKTTSKHYRDHDLDRISKGELRRCERTGMTA